MNLVSAIVTWFVAPFRAQAPAALVDAPAALGFSARPAAASCRDPDWAPEKVGPEAMASALLDWLRGEGGKTGIIPAAEMQAIWRELCLDRGWLDENWRETAAALRRLIGRPKQDFASIRGRRTVVYRIAAAGAVDLFGATACAGQITREAA
jgi:hypothetical protein